MKSLELSVIIPVFNEERNLEVLLNRSLTVLRSALYSFELILVDDGSTDRSSSMIRRASEAHAEVVGVLLNRNYGQHAAIMAGFEQSIGDVVVTLDADLQNPPEEIPRLMRMIEQGHDVVGSVRVNRQDNAFRRTASLAVNWVVRRSTGIGMRDYGCMLRAYRRDIVDAMLACSEKSTFIPVLANSFANCPGELDVRHDHRQDGQSKYNFLKLIVLQFDLLTSMTTFPIRILTFLGISFAAIGLVFSLSIMVLRMIYGPTWAVDGVFTIMAVLLAFMGIQLLGLGLIGEYVGRIFVQVRSRPSYWVRETVGTDSGHRIASVKEAIR